MIFSRFFKPSFQDADPKKRIQSISELDPSLAKDKQKLHELAFNDVDASVSLAALEQLNSFALWLKMSQIAVDKRIRKNAENKVIELLSDPSSELLSDKERRVSILESSVPAVIKLGLEQPDVYQLQAEDLVAMLDKLNDQAYQRQYMLRTESPELQLILLQRLDDLTSFQKLLKKPLHSESIRWLEGRVEELLAQAERPVTLQRQIILLLSKLKALSETSDYAKIIEERQALATQIQPLNLELATFDAELSDANSTKLEAINQRLDIICEQLKPAYEEQQLKIQQQQKTTEWLKHADSVVEEATKVTEQALVDAEVPELSSYIEQLKSLIAQQATLAPIQTTLVKIKLESLQQSLLMLKQLPELIMLGSQLYSAIDHFKNTYALPESYQDLDQARHIFNAMERQVSEMLKSSDGQLPRDALKPWNAIKNEWLGTLSALKKQAEQQLSSADKKINTVNSMIKQGRFKPAFAVFSKVKRTYEDLPGSLQSRIERAYQGALERINELEDWQHYIAQPRKPEVLAEVTALAEQSDDIDVQQRRKDVERLRKTWNSFGRLDTPEDDSLNTQFDEAIERAFSPCRTFFAKQQQERELNAELAAKILTELQSCDNDNDDDALFLKSYAAVIKQWNSLGQIESATWRELKQQFHQLNKPLKQRQSNIQKANASAKQKLVDKANEAAELEAPESAQIVKQLQSQWKAIGFAGRGRDSQLWHAFKQANDLVFDKVRAGRAETKQVARETYEQLLARFDSVESELKGVKKLEQIREINIALDTVNQDLNECYQQAKLDKKLFETLSRKHQYLLSNVAELTDRINHSRANQQLDEAFDYLSSRVGEPVLIEQDAPKLLKTALVNTREQASDRLALTIRLELLAGAESLEKDAELRKQLQLEMMAKKMQSGDRDSVKQIFSDWLSAGPIQESEKGLLARLANAYRLAENLSNVKG